MARRRKHYILRLDSFVGRDSYLHCGGLTQEFLYCVVMTNPDGTAEVVDSGYRSEEEARDAWRDPPRDHRPKTHASAWLLKNQDDTPAQAAIAAGIEYIFPRHLGYDTAKRFAEPRSQGLFRKKGGTQP